MTWTAGGTDVKTAFVGSTALAGLYVGDKKVWPTGPALSDHPSTGAVVSAPITVNRQPLGMAFTEDSKTMFVANYGAGNVSVIDVDTLAVKATIPGVAGFYSAAVVGSKLFVLHNGVKMHVFDTVTYAAIGSPIPTAGAVRLAAAWGKLFTSGSLYEIDAATLTATPSPGITSNTRGTVGTFGIAASHSGAKLYLASQGSGLFVADPATLTITAGPISMYSARGVAVTLDDKKVYVGTGDGTVHVINATTLTELKKITVGGTDLYDAVASPDGKYIFVTGSTTNNVHVIDIATDTLVRSVAVGTTPYGIAVTPDGGKVFVSNFGAGTVQAIT